MHRLLPLSCLLALSGNAIAATPPILERAAATICAATGKGATQGWTPDQGQIEALEKSLGNYFAKLQEAKSNLPAPEVTYARQYSGVFLEGRRLIHGRFYPGAEPAPTFAKAGDCWVTSDGGNRYWDVYFDPETGRVIGHRVNGKA